MSFTKEFFQEFASEVQERLAWSQIINAPNVSQKQLEQGNFPHGLYLNRDNVNLVGLDLEAATAMGFKFHEQSFQDGEVVSEGFISNRIRFAVLHRTPVVIESSGNIVGYLFKPGTSEFSDVAMTAKETPEMFRKKTWWLVALLDDNNNLISKTPLKITLSGAVGAAFNQEFVKAIDEYEVAFFAQAGQPRKGLTPKAHASFVMDWVLAPFKGQGKAPYEFVAKRAGVVNEEKAITRYKSGNATRQVCIYPTAFESLLILPSSDTGKQILEWRETFEKPFYSRIRNFESSKVTLIEPTAEYQADEEVSESSAQEDFPF